MSRSRFTFLFVFFLALPIAVASGEEKTTKVMEPTNSSTLKSMKSIQKNMQQLQKLLSELRFLKTKIIRLRKSAERAKRAKKIFITRAQKKEVLLTTQHKRLRAKANKLSIALSRKCDALKTQRKSCGKFVNSTHKLLQGKGGKINHPFENVVISN